MAWCIALQPRGVISVGPWGGSGGQPFYMRGASAPRLRSIILYHSGAVHSLSCEYTLAGDYGGPPPRVTGPWGLPDSYGSRGVRTQVTTNDRPDPSPFLPILACISLGLQKLCEYIYK